MRCLKRLVQNEVRIFEIQVYAIVRLTSQSDISILRSFRSKAQDSKELQKFPLKFGGAKLQRILLHDLQ